MIGFSQDLETTASTYSNWVWAPIRLGHLRRWELKESPERRYLDGEPISPAHVYTALTSMLISSLKRIASVRFGRIRGILVPSASFGATSTISRLTSSLTM